MMEVAMASTSRNESGMLLLNSLEEVKIRQKPRCGGHMYVITTTDGQEVFMAKEDTTTLGCMDRGGGSERTFHMAISDLQEREVLRLRRPFTCGPNKMEVFIGSELACTIREQNTWLTPVFCVKDSSDRVKLRVKGHKCDRKDYDIQTPDKESAGKITKCWAGWAKELSTRADSYHIVFPKNLHEDDKAALIGVCILIDYRFFSSDYDYVDCSFSCV